MSPLYRLVAALLASVFLAGTPLHAWTAQPGVACAANPVATTDSGCCDRGDTEPVSACSVICPVGGVAVGEGIEVSRSSVSHSPAAQSSVPLASEARAPDTAPPKSSVA